MRGSEAYQLSTVSAHGTTTIYVTHDQIEAMTLADQVVVMNGGVIEQEGAPLDLYDNPASLFVTAFIGSPPMNFFEGDLIEGPSLRLGDGTLLELPASDAAGRARIILGIRPEHLELADTGWPAIVSVVEPTGSETQITARIAGNFVRVLTRGRTDVRAGDTIHLHAAPELLHIFDAGTKPKIAQIEDVA